MNEPVDHALEECHRTVVLLLLRYLFMYTLRRTRSAELNSSSFLANVVGKIQKKISALHAQ
jgi:hypothetical protein